MTPLRRLVLALVTGVLVLAACGSDSEVGKNELFEFDQDQAERLGATSSTDKAGTTTTAAASKVTTTTQASATTMQVTTTAPPEKQEVSVEVRICDDTQGCPNQFDPRIAIVGVGGKVRFKNTGTKTYSVQATNGAFSSPPIKPGAVWVYTATTRGQFDYADGSRPYAVGTIQVQ